VLCISCAIDTRVLQLRTNCTEAALARGRVPVKSIVSEVPHLVSATAGEATINTATLRN
jgi:hypothetical protein